jgi:hypothetical protein
LNHKRKRYCIFLFRRTVDSSKEQHCPQNVPFVVNPIPSKYPHKVFASFVY